MLIYNSKDVLRQAILKIRTSLSDERLDKMSDNIHVRASKTAIMFTSTGRLKTVFRGVSDMSFVDKYLFVLCLMVFQLYNYEVKYTPLFN